jgi:hypothetical protein
MLGLFLRKGFLKLVREHDLEASIKLCMKASRERQKSREISPLLGRWSEMQHSMASRAVI